MGEEGGEDGRMGGKAAFVVTTAAAAATNTFSRIPVFFKM